MQWFCKRKWHKYTFYLTTVSSISFHIILNKIDDFFNIISVFQTSQNMKVIFFFVNFNFYTKFTHTGAHNEKLERGIVHSLLYLLVNIYNLYIYIYIYIYILNIENKYVL